MTVVRLWKKFFPLTNRMRDGFEWKRPKGFETKVIIYNPVTKTKEPLILRHNNVATWYMCGPTVYDSAHIGHASTYVKFDIIRRILNEFFDIDTVLVMGLTDMDDKIINRSNVSGKSWQSLVSHYEDEFFSDMDSLSVQRPFMTCKVTAHIPEIIAFIEKIERHNKAYVGTDGSVYFEASSCTNYGKLGNFQDEEKHPHKKSSLDFALWKASKENEPYWDSPWGPGRPGWHIECSAIASNVFGNCMDLHSGGVDLAFPHHENEEAQSCCYHNVDQWVNYWLHTGHLHLDGDVKMSKSLNNTISIADMLKTLSADEFRMLCLLCHYRKNVNFATILIKNAVTTLKKITFFLSDCNDYVTGNVKGGCIDEPELLKCLANTRTKVTSALADDFNTPKALSYIEKLIAVTNQMFKTDQKEGKRSPGAVAAVSTYIHSFTKKLGIFSNSNAKGHSDVSKLLDVIVEFRQELRTTAMERNKDIELLKACDTLRKNLSSCGVDIRDVKGGKSSWTLRDK
ncbi:hypothetical protein QAD02_004726 [Eretmocerus hayati]|uniref:Uncharacterized protein n=1 Tax=Eretmocerus hayati TaxID=131215 RepID=A0ACC2NQC6_9HYME|nr:hypothetical protein QAD02_004726 [Eretmocerus hayati]